MLSVPEFMLYDHFPSIGETPITDQLLPTPFPWPIDPTSPPYSTHIHNGVFLDLDSTSSSEGELEGYPVITHGILEDWVDREGGGANEEDNVDSVYMFAWALDGRRIGESGAANAGRSDSPNSAAPIIGMVSLFRGWKIQQSNITCLYLEVE